MVLDGVPRLAGGVDDARALIVVIVVARARGLHSAAQRWPLRKRVCAKESAALRSVLLTLRKVALAAASARAVPTG